MAAIRESHGDREVFFFSAIRLGSALACLSVYVVAKNCSPGPWQYPNVGVFRVSHWRSAPLKEAPTVTPCPYPLSLSLAHH